MTLKYLNYFSNQLLFKQLPIKYLYLGTLRYQSYKGTFLIGCTLGRQSYLKTFMILIWWKKLLFKMAKSEF